jgi:hypothetical protein
VTLLACTQILVGLRNADPTALTARECLQHSLGYGERLAEVRRYTLWEMRGGEGVDPRPGVERLIRTGGIANPNKETTLVRLPGHPASCLGSLFEEGSEYEMFLSWDPERDLAPNLGTLLGSGEGAWQFARGTLWALRWRDEEPAARRRLSEEAVLCRGPRKGLLVHPHLEDYRRVLPEDPVPWLPPTG